MAAYLIPVFLIIAGLLVLIAGGEALVRGAAALAAAVRISPLVIGLTVVAFGTSAPELAVGVRSAWTGQADLAIGNIVGSNITNVLLILGLSALAAPLTVASQLIRLDVPVMIAASCAMLAMGLDGTISRLDGCVLFVFEICYTAWLIRQSSAESEVVKAEFCMQVSICAPKAVGRLLIHFGLMGLGLALLAFGSHWVVTGAVDVAQLIGVEELTIGLTVVAVGTSLPELVTSVVASVRGQRDIAVGNIVGSNVFNILCVLGLSSIVAPNGIGVSSTALRSDIPVMIAVAVACLPIFFTGNLIARWEGGLLVAYYFAYTAYLVMAAMQAATTRTFGMIMIAFVIPLTAVTLVVCIVRAVRERSAKQDVT